MYGWKQYNGFGLSLKDVVRPTCPSSTAKVTRSASQTRGHQNNLVLFRCQDPSTEFPEARLRFGSHLFCRFYDTNTVFSYYGTYSSLSMILDLDELVANTQSHSQLTHNHPTHPKFYISSDDITPFTMFRELFMKFVILYNTLNEKSDLHFVRSTQTNENISNSSRGFNFRLAIRHTVHSMPVHTTWGCSLGFS